MAMYKEIRLIQGLAKFSICRGGNAEKEVMSSKREYDVLVPVPRREVSIFMRFDMNVYD